MGMHSEAVMWYGFELDEDEFNEFQSDNETEDDFFDMDDYWENKTGHALGYDGLEFGYHCHIEEPVYFIATSVYCAWQGEAMEVDTKVSPEWNDRLKKFCEITGLRYKEPKWMFAGVYR